MAVISPRIQARREHGGTEADGATALPVVVQGASTVLAVSAPLYRDALGRHLAGDGRFEVLGKVGDGPGAIEAARILRPAIVVLGERLGEPSGAELVRAVLSVSASSAIAMIGDPGSTLQVLDALSAGARGYLDADEPGARLAEMLHRLGQGEVVLTAAASEALVSSIRSQGEGVDASPTPRDLKLLEMLGGGQTARAMGRALYVSEATVKSYLHRLYAKLGSNDRASAVAEAMRRGWLS